VEVSHGRYELAARLQYGAGLRLSELVRLRVQDVDVGRGTLTVRLGKGDKDRVTVLPKSLREEIARQIERAREVWQGDREAGLAGVYMPGRWRGSSAGGGEFEWFWLFPARQTRWIRLRVATPGQARLRRTAPGQVRNPGQASSSSAWAGV
jgi:integrase